MDAQKKELIKMIFTMMKQVYAKTLQLEDAFGSQSIHIFAKNYDPLTELLEVLAIDGEGSSIVSALVGIYLEDEMTVDEIIIELETLVAS